MVTGVGGLNARARERKRRFTNPDLSRGVGTSSCFSSAKKFSREKIFRARFYSFMYTQ